MSDTIAKPVPQAKKPRQGRSPSFPFIALSKALERAEAFRIAEGGRPRHFSPLTSAAGAWSMGSKTGPFLQTVAALGHFGLLEYQGSGDTRSMRLTDAAFQILLDKQPISPERDSLIQRLALMPAIHGELWQRWEAALPSAATLETYLVRDRGFSETGARDLISEYKETIAFAKMGQPGIIPPVNDGIVLPKEDKSEISAGDLIQIEIDGSFILEKADRVREIQEHEGRRWVFVETSETGIPMEQAVLVKKAEGMADAIPPLTPPKLPLKPSTIVQPGSGDRREVFALDEGDVVLSYPENLSAASFHDLEGYLQLFLRKAQRRSKASDYFAEIYARDGFKAKEARYFDDFASLTKFIVEFQTSHSTDILRVHLPARATDNERRSVVEAGAQFM